MSQKCSVLSWLRTGAWKKVKIVWKEVFQLNGRKWSGANFYTEIRKQACAVSISIVPWLRKATSLVAKKSSRNTQEFISISDFTTVYCSSDTTFDNILRDQSTCLSYHWWLRDLNISFWNLFLVWLFFFLICMFVLFVCFCVQQQLQGCFPVMYTSQYLCSCVISSETGSNDF